MVNEVKKQKPSITPRCAQFSPVFVFTANGESFRVILREKYKNAKKVKISPPFQ